ncbi:MAG: bacillithiol biosynthesis BshC, partial [Armatimonadetes bacterium]|nr:bacillithiol biosynthesis BshC [Armatimonadota bacterium]
GDLNAVVARVARAELGGETEGLFAAGVSAVEDAVSRLTAHAAGVDASLQRTGETLLNRFRGELAEFEKKVQRALKREDEVLTRRLAEAQAHLAPEGGLQERRLSAAGLVGRYGEAVVDALADAMQGEPLDHHLVVRLEP